MRQIRGAKIGMIFQDPMTSLNPVKTIGWQLEEAVLIHQDVTQKEARKHAIDILKEVEIPHADPRVDDYPHQFSGGMRQRVMIAMALINNPEILIADEPTTALDVTTQAQILRLMERLQEEYQMAIVMITHDLGVVAELADDVIVMYGGEWSSRPRSTICSRSRRCRTRGACSARCRASTRRADVSSRFPASRRRCSTRRAGARSTRAAST